jgi:integrating conjugative element relaxase (TIGR03760 family)
MLKWVTAKLNRSKEQVTPVSHHADARLGFRPQSADELLSLASRKRALQQLWDNSPFSRSVWEAFWLAPVRELTVRIQQLPAAETGPYAREGGMLDEALEVAVCAVRLSRGWMLPPGAAPEEQAAQGAAWCTAIFWAALLHDVGALHHMAAFHEDGSRWYSGLAIPELPWRVRFSPGQGDAVVWGAMIAYRLLPEDGLRWLSRWPQIIDLLMIYLSGHKNAAAILHAAVTEARYKCGLESQVIVLRDVKLPVEVAGTISQNAPASSQEHESVNPASSPVTAISDSYTPSQIPDATLSASGLASAIGHNEFANDAENNAVMLQKTGGTPGELLNILDQITANESVSQPDTAPVIEMAAQLSPSDERPRPLHSDLVKLSSGEHFWQWLVSAVTDGSVTVNAQDSLLHVMTQYVFLQTPECFYRYLAVQQNSEIKKDDLQKNFESLDRHYSRNGKGIYIYRKYENEKREGRYTKLSGYMIPFNFIFTNGLLPPDSPWLSPNK